MPESSPRIQQGETRTVSLRLSATALEMINRENGVRKGIDPSSRPFSIESLREKLCELLVDKADPAWRLMESVPAVDMVAELLVRQRAIEGNRASSARDLRDGVAVGRGRPNGRKWRPI